MNYRLKALVIAMTLSSAASAINSGTNLEEVVVTAQKREQSLQETPIAISALGAKQLQQAGITSLDGLGQGAIPSLRIQPFPNSPSTLTIAIRGNGPADPGQLTREPSVGIYLDNIYLGRAQGLAADFADLERIEVLRGPQGTLFGRNATGGAVNMISKAPTGEFHFSQKIGIGSLDERNYVTHLDLPEWNKLRVKLDYMNYARDGWVTNTAPGEDDYNALKKEGGIFTTVYQPLDSLSLKLVLDKSRISATQNYFQLYIDNTGFVGKERDRMTKTRAPAVPLNPTVTDQTGYSLTASWDISDRLTIRSLTAYRGLDEDTDNNYGAAIPNGLRTLGKLDQSQLSQEFQFLGSADQWNWVGGIFYYRERGTEWIQNLSTLCTYCNPPNSPIIPSTNEDLFNPGHFIPTRTIHATSESLAAYGQATWTAPWFDNRLDLTVGLRYTEDQKSGSRVEHDYRKYRLTTDHIDPAFTANFKWTSDFSTYVKYSTAYKAAGVNGRSQFFEPYKEETVKSYEAGAKAEFFNRRVRTNLAIFESKTYDPQTDYANPADVSVSETNSGKYPVRVRGAELDIDAILLEDLTLGLSYTYLNGHMPDQPNPHNNNIREPFEVTQTPRHAGAATLDYVFGPQKNLQAHIDVTSTSPYAYCPKCFQRFDGYTIWNARFTWSDIPLGQEKGRGKISVFGRNLTDEEYIVYSLPIGDPLLMVDQAFGDPRTFGLEFTFEY